MYEAISEQLSSSWDKAVMSQLGSLEKETTSLPKLVFDSQWLQQETERNLENLGEYFSGEKQELALNIDLEPVKSQMNDQMVLETGTASPELSQPLPDKIDILGNDGLVSEQIGYQIYRLKVASEGMALSLKVLAFLLILTTVTFFLLLPQDLAFKWLGSTLLFSGMWVFSLTFGLRVLAVTYLRSVVEKKLSVVPNLIDESTYFLDKLLQTYLGLIQWQSAFICLIGGLILLLLKLFKKKE